MDEIGKIVNSFKTKHKEGFMPDELEEILKQFPDMNMEKYDSAMMGNTCMMFDGKFCIYHCDVETAIRCGVENRDLRFEEWD